jgi:hypothetical protein
MEGAYALQMKIATLLFILLASSGCAVIGPLPTTYRVIIDSFTPDETLAVLDALQSWRDAVPALKLNVQIGRCSGSHDREICLHASDAATVKAHDPLYFPLVNASTAGPDWQTSGAETWIDCGRSESVMQTVVAHELAHAMGQLQHTTPGFGPSVLYADLADDAPGPTCNDAAVWYSNRGAVYPGCP